MQQDTHCRDLVPDHQEKKVSGVEMSLKKSDGWLKVYRARLVSILTQYLRDGIEKFHDMINTLILYWYGESALLCIRLQYRSAILVLYWFTGRM